ncbi:MAG: hypothetical protein HY261_05310 [Chloroflexi bacterium]|nr:hypothetical protein [Chloroflexota bacterium]
MMHSNRTHRLAAAIAIAIPLVAIACLFALLSWSHGSSIRFETGKVGGAAGDLLLHVAVSLALALPMPHPGYAVLALAAGVGVDFDHLGALAGAPILRRGSHSIVFFAIAAAIVALLAIRFRRQSLLSPILAAAVVVASLLGHIAADALLGEGRFPLWSPVSYRLVTLSRLEGGLLLVGAFAVVLTALLITTYRRRLAQRPAREETSSH